jgi:hypothetical protein
MDRSQFLCSSLGVVCASAGALVLPAKASAETAPACDEQLKKEKGDREFIEHWLEDLLGTMSSELDEPTRIKLIEGCGRGCFRRHQFKVDLARRAEGSLDKLIAAYQDNFEAWREGDVVHIRYGAVSKRCYCPVVRSLPAKPNDLHCECTRATHQAVF